MTRDGKRLFVGMRVSVATANALGGCAETLARRARDAGVDFRWVASTNYHVTLKFLGWTGTEAIGAVEDAVRRATTGVSRMSFRTTRLGGFPALDKATVLWAGVEDQGALAPLAAAIDRETATLGFAPDKRPFHAHVTLARLRDPRPIRDVVLPLAEQMFGDTRIDGVILFESETKSSGPVYRELARIGFKSVAEAENRQRDDLEQGTPDREPDTDDGWPRGHHDEF